MASSSSSPVIASSDVKACSYDVFLSFSGEDTRNSFTDHLYYVLEGAGFRTFRDNEGINKGEELKTELKQAIEGSRASIVVLSKNYATSTWCLDELLLILQQRKECNHFVLPVFYGVEPTDVKNQTGNFALQVKPSSKWTDDNVNKWKTALIQVANLAGHVLSGPETSFLKGIVDTIYNELDHKKVYLPLDIIGMASHNEGINYWLEQCNLEFLVIYGMGGSGKTTLAKYIYHSNLKKFEHVSFLEDIGRTCEGSNGLLVLQEQLLNDISWGKWRKVPAVSRGTPLIEDALKMNKALIVLDDIVERKQLVALLGTGKINAQSKIIITTRENTDNWFDFSCWRCQKYEMTLLNDVESSQLLCRHAFGSKTPIAGFEEFVLPAVQYCEGNPLALEVLGSSFSHNNTIDYWKSQLNLLDRDMHLKIQDVLQTSYESLPYKSVKMLFLHIACFFVGKDLDYVIKILEPDYSAILGIQTLINRCLLSVSPNKKLTMHRLLQEMGKNIVRQESDRPANRSRVWLSSDSYTILRKRMGSKTLEGLALDMKMLPGEDIAFKSSSLRTDALNNMDRLKFLQLNFVKLNGSYENFSEDLRWLCWLGCHLTTIPPNLYMRNLVAIDMSYSKLEVFEPPMDLQSLRILNLKDSHNLTEIRNIFKIPYLETLILWNCCSLVNVCNTLGDLKDLALLNMTGCNTLTKPTFPLPSSLHRLFLKDCHLECTDSFPLSFRVQLDLQYLNLGNSLFEFLPCYNHLENLRVLDLSFCSRLKCLICLPSTLAELYIYGCELLERITFQSSRFTLQEFGYLGCIQLYEVEGLFKLVPIAILDETDLGHMKWLLQYQYHEVCLGGDDELTVDRSWHIQMLYEFDIMSTSLPDMKDPNMTPEYISNSSSLSFNVPSCPKNKRLKGINVSFKYAISSDECSWFCKISTANGVGDLLYNPKVFGKPDFGDVCVWLSYWPIGHIFEIGDTVNVSIVVLSGLEVHECGVSLVYSDEETLENKMECAEVLGGDLSGFHLSTGAYYLCRRDFFELVEVGRLTPDWFRILVGDTVDNTEVRGWRKTGRPKHMNPSATEVKTIRCIIHGPQLEENYNMAKMSKSSIGDKTVAFTSRLLERETKYGSRSELIDETTEMPLQKAQQIILRWDPTVSKDARAHMIFQGDFQEIDDYLQAVDEIQRSLESSNDDERLKEINTTIKIAMARLEYEFHNILISHATSVETESLTELISSIQLTSKGDSSLVFEFHEMDDHMSLGSSLFDHTSLGSSLFDHTSLGGSLFSEFHDSDDHISLGGSSFSEFHDADDYISSWLEQGESSTTMANSRSMSSIREIDLIPFDRIYDLRCIAKCMITARYFRECVQVYSSVRKSAVNASLKKLGVKKFSIDDIQRLEWEALNSEIGKWIRATGVCVRVLFASEKRLCQLIFEDLGTDAEDACFMETVNASAIQLFNVAEVISISRRSSENLFKILDIHDALLDLMPDIKAVFDSKSSESIRVQATEILSRLAEAARGMLSEFENTILREPSKVPVPGGTIHPLTRYVMNYISLISNYKQTLGELIVSRPATATGSRYSDDLTTPDMDFADHEGRSPLELHLIWIIIILQFNLEGKSKHYNYDSLAYVFMMNNIHYIVQKIRGSPELREMIGDDYLKKLTGKYRQAATRYQRATWAGVLHCLRDEGLHITGTFSSRVSTSALRERFKLFNAMFNEVHRTQALWLIPNTQLREELQISISEELIPAYRAFLGRFRTLIVHGRDPENYIKYSVEDLETAVHDFFEGKAANQLRSRMSNYLFQLLFAGSDKANEWAKRLLI